MATISTATQPTATSQPPLRRVAQTNDFDCFLAREADVVMAFSNEKWINRFSGDSSLLDIFDALDRHVAASVQAVTYSLIPHPL